MAGVTTTRTMEEILPGIIGMALVEMDEYANNLNPGMRRHEKLQALAYGFQDTSPTADVPFEWMSICPHAFVELDRLGTCGGIKNPKQSSHYCEGNQEYCITKKRRDWYARKLNKGGNN